jgi:ATP-dependent Lon protease
MLPIIPLRDTVVFPDTIMTLFVGRDSSMRALEYAIQEHLPILLLAQRNPTIEEPQINDLYDVGTVAQITQLINLPDQTIKVLIQGKKRVKVKHVVFENNFLQAVTNDLEDQAETSDEAIALHHTLFSEFKEYAKLNRRVSPEMLESILELANDEEISYLIAGQLALSIEERQELISMTSSSQRMEKVLIFLKRESEILNAEDRIRQRIKSQMEKSQREYYLQEQMKAIQKELRGDSSEDEMDILERKIKEAKLPTHANERATSELRKLRNMNPMAAEASVIRNYVDWILDLPWNLGETTPICLDNAKKILDRDHHGLDKVKERILEFLAVQKRVGQVRGQILCFVGPPGVGKTSLGKSIAEATDRKYVRVSLGGLKDESEIRGHRRTYIGSMPGRIIQNMKKAKSINPLFLLDEIEKMGADWRGDPASAMLEVLDPEQNKAFNDHYLEVDYDLSHVMFVATANSLSLPTPLLDRMEIIQIPGYTEEEKLAIAKHHLVAKQQEANGLKAEEWSITDDALRNLIRYYTREAGVRSLEREISKLARKAVSEITIQKKPAVHVTEENLTDYLGPQQFKFAMAEATPQLGTTTGLAWTQAGGDLLSIEAVKVPGSGKISCTGKLGEVMQESVQTAFSYVRSRFSQWDVDPNFFSIHDIHVHVPEGATPKDGPSAGTAICTSVVSILTKRPVRADIAMTGEITLRGHVLPIGGLKEKLLAAARGAIKTVCVPKDNEKDLVEVSPEVKDKLEIILVSNMEEVLFHALTDQPAQSKTDESSKKNQEVPAVFPEDLSKPATH